MKRRKARFLAALLTLSLLVSLLTGVTAQAASDDPYDALIFDAEEAYQGEYTVTDQENVGGTIVFKTYQVTYVTKPITGLTWADAPSENYFKMNIKVPVSYNGAAFDQAAMADAPILFYNPWGGDAGAPVRDPSALAAKSNTGSIIGRALSEGWVVVEPGMRGAANCFVGTPDEDDYVNYGKLPRPLADLKAAIRYLRYGTNESTIPGDKERIFVAGSSSGGSATVMLGASGNSSFFDPYLEEIGAAPGRDDIFAAMPSCPVMTRAWGDPAIAWERWGDLTGNEEANEINVALTQAFVEYQAELGLKAEFDVGDTIRKGDLLTADNYADYLMVYLKESALKFLNGLGGREAIEAYLAEDLAANSMYNTPDASRDWIDPIYDENNPDLVVDIGGTWEEFWAYVVGEDYFDPANLLDMQYERPITATDEMMAGNGVVNSLVGDRYSKYANASSFSFGKESDYAAVFSDFGQAWIQEERGIEISQEYLDLIELQRNSVDPLYFVLGDGAADATVCQNWFMRTGSVDLVTPHPVFFNLATALENKGMNVDAALVWDQKHGLTSDMDGFFAFADALLEQDTDEEPAEQTGFTDVAADAWYADAVAYVSENGLMSGDGSGSFDVSDPLSRGMLAQILYNKEGKPAVSAASPFTDVAADAWYAQAVIWAADAQIVSGYDGAYNPNGSITREQLAVMLYRYMGSPETAGDLSAFSDAGSVSDYAAQAMAWAVEQGIITGSGSNALNPQGAATRAEVAVMLTRLAASETA